MPYAQEAGLLVIDHQGVLRTHWNLCGALIFPTIAEGEITDLRARKLDAGAKARSLAGSPHDRGAMYPFGWDDIGAADTVMLTENQQPSLLRIRHEIRRVFGEIAHERVTIIQRVAEQIMHGDSLIHATFRKSGERIGIGTIHQPAMCPQRGQLIQLAIGVEVCGTRLSRAG